MGADIHYILERQDKDGKWHTTLTEDYLYQYYEENNLSEEEKYNSPQEEVSARNYRIFSQLSGVRGKGYKFAIPGLPDDIAHHSEEIIEQSYDNHSRGHLYGNQIFDLINHKKWPKELDYWPKAVIETIKKFPEILPTAENKSNEEFYYKSNPHHDLDRKIKTKELSDIEKHPEKWRILIYYDS